MHSMASRSSLELMLDKIQRQEEDNEEDFVPALPVRPVSKARLPSGKKARLIKFQPNDLVNGFTEKEITTKEAKQKCSYGENGDHDYHMQKGSTMDYAEKMDQLQGILEIQKYFRGHQARCYYHDLKTGILALQSFVRAENARNKKNTRSRTLQTQETAVVLLQSVVRGWLGRRHIKCNESMSKQSMQTADKKDYVHIPYCEVVELQRRVLKTEAALQYKKDENSSLRLQLKQYEEKWHQSEAKMKSLEKMWQDQFTFIQVSLAKKSNAAKNAKPHIRIMDYIPLHHDIYHVDQTMPEKTNTPNGSLVKTGQKVSDTNPRGELQKLTFQFEAWKKDYKIQLREAKEKFQEINGVSKMKRCGKKWREI